VWSASPSRRTAPAAAPPAAGAPHEPPTSPTAEQGRTTVNDEAKRYAPAPAVARTAPRTPTRAAARSCAQVALAMGLAAATACAHVVKTGFKAGDCSWVPAHRLGGRDLPDSLDVWLDEEQSRYCTGKRMIWTGLVQDEPCPVFDKLIILRTSVNQLYGQEIWGGPLIPRKRIRLFGLPSIIPGKGTWVRELTPEPTERKTIGRLTALITDIVLEDGTRWPVCGVLFSSVDSQEGIPILSPEYYGKPVTGAWGHLRVRFFW